MPKKVKNDATETESAKPCNIKKKINRCPPDVASFQNRYGRTFAPPLYCKTESATTQIHRPQPQIHQNTTAAPQTPDPQDLQPKKSPKKIDLRKKKKETKNKIKTFTFIYDGGDAQPSSMAAPPRTTTTKIRCRPKKCNPPSKAPQIPQN